MSVVAWDGNVLATDRMANDGSLKWESSKAWYVVSKQTGKICIVSGVGMLAHILEMRDWFRDSGNPEDLNIPKQTAELIVVDDEGLAVYSYNGTSVRLSAPMAFGEGREYALGAMAVGADATQAVHVANEYSLHCGKGVECFTIQEGKAKTLTEA